MQKTKYIAYGSNLNLSQMAKRCPTARVVGSGMLRGYRLQFNGVATIVKDENAQTPIAVWELEREDEEALDRYEGYPNLYRKEFLEVKIRGKTITAMVYIMNSDNPNMPTHSYFETILDGYNDVGLDTSFLRQALEAVIPKSMR